MHRATPLNSAFRSYSAGGSRATISEVDDSKQMQEMSGNMMKGESRKEVEHPQNYGFSSCVHDADKDGDGKMTDSAEGFMSYMGGNRSFPVMHIMDDRRHRIHDLGKGDSAMYRGKDDRQQFHLHEKGNFMTCREDKKMRFALVPKESEGQGGQGGGGGGGGGGGVGADVTGASSLGAAATGGGGGGGGGGGQGGQSGQQKKGQKPTYDDNEKSETFIEQKKDHTRVNTKEGSMGIKAGKNTQFEAEGKHIRKGEWHGDKEMYVNANVNAKDHIAGGGTTITGGGVGGGGGGGVGAAITGGSLGGILGGLGGKGGGLGGILGGLGGKGDGKDGAQGDQPQHWDAQGKKGTTSLLQTAAKVGTLGGMMGSISGILSMFQQQQSGGQSQEQREDMEQRLRELEEQRRRFDELDNWPI